MKDWMRTARVGAILNTASGSCDETSEEKMRAIFHAEGIRDAAIWCGGADYIAQAFTEAGAHKLDVLIVLGGDGTIRTAATSSVENGPLLITLPGGTMNMLPKALYGERTWEQALSDTLADPVRKAVSGGEVNGERFFVAAMFGAPALFAEVREAVRNNDLGAGLDKGIAALQNMFANQLDYSFTTTTAGSAEAVSVICPLISTALADTEQTLEAAAVTVSDAAAAIVLASVVAFGKWRDDRNVLVTRTRRIHLTSEKDIPAILDGETFTFGNEIDVTFVPVAFNALVPRAT